MEQDSFQFLEYELKPAAYELRCENVPVKLERIPMELLILLTEMPGRLVTREMIVERLWGSDVFLETEHSINTAINKLRVTLHDRPKQPRCIQTVVGKGYRFIADVTVVAAPAASAHGAAAALMTSTSLPSITGLTSARSDELSATPGTPKTSALETGPVSIPVARRQLGKRMILVASSIVLLIAILGYFFQRHTANAHPHTAVRFGSVAVLPFLNLSSQAEKDYLVDGTTDQLITLLAQNTSLRVISRTSVMQFKGARTSLPDIAAALKVDAIVEGSILRTEKGTRITVQLVDARRDQHLWAQSYAENEADSLGEEDRVTADMALHILNALTGQVQPGLAQAQHGANPKARDLFLRGGYFWHQRTLESLNKAIDCYKQAIQVDPGYAEAYAALGQAYVLLSSYGGPGPAQPLLQAKEIAERALQLNSRLGQAHTVLAVVKVDQDWDWQGAEQEFRRAAELDPNDSTTHHWFALHLARLHRFPEAEAEMQRALELDPISVIIQTDAAEIAYQARQPQEAEVRLRRALELDPNFAEAHLVYSKIFLEQRKLQSALVELQRALQLFGPAPNVEAIRAHALAIAGQRQEAEEIANVLEAQSRQRYVSGVDIAIAYCGLGDLDKAMYWLERGLRVHDKGMDILAAEPLFDNCRRNPADRRFDDLLRRLKFQ
jgi:TolB-like protein/DNA-binding winged helix-turn-helix (wHTH) protein/Tfp pilus assembly protein PilF